MSDSDDDDFEVPPEVAERQRRAYLERVQKATITQNTPPVAAIAASLSHTVLEGIVQTFRQDGAGNCIANYVNRGMEINSDLRSNKGSTSSEVACLDRYAIPMGKVVPGDYAVIYRSMNVPYSDEHNSGFISTFDNAASSFGGTYRMKIYVPSTARILVANISEKMKKTGSSSYPTVYEIILPRGTKLQLIGERNNIYYYLAIPPGSTDRKLLERIGAQIAEDLE